jgi:hypothetical protein
MTKSTGSQTQPEAIQPDPKLKPLEILVGAWDMEVLHPADPTQTVLGKMTFEWLQGGTFLIQRSHLEDPTFPTTISIIGYNDTTGNYTQHYFDSRGVGRVYEMSLLDNTWRLWRQAPGFSQRFFGTFSADGNTITSRWEKAIDGLNWEHDFNLTYTKAN